MPAEVKNGRPNHRVKAGRPRRPTSPASPSPEPTPSPYTAPPVSPSPIPLLAEATAGEAPTAPLDWRPPFVPSQALLSSHRLLFSHTRASWHTAWGAGRCAEATPHRPRVFWWKAPGSGPSRAPCRTAEASAPTAWCWRQWRRRPLVLGCIWRWCRARRDEETPGWLWPRGFDIGSSQPLAPLRLGVFCIPCWRRSPTPHLSRLRQSLLRLPLRQSLICLPQSLFRLPRSLFRLPQSLFQLPRSLAPCPCLLQ